MTTPIRLGAVLLALSLTSCTVTEPQRAGDPVPGRSTDFTAPGIDGDPAGPAREIAGTPRPGRANAPELAVWNDPEFRSRFAESYAAETEIEPKVTADERETMLAILDLIARDQLDEAAARLEAGRNPASSAVFDFTLANIHFQNDRFDRAAVAYRTAVDKFPKFRRAWRQLGVTQIRRGDFEKAIPAFTRVIELGGGDAVTYGLLAHAHANVDDQIAAESAYRTAILFDPHTLDWKTGLARSLFRQQRYADAAALLGNLIAARPDDADLWMLQAGAYIGMQQPKKAAENYVMVERLGKATVESTNNLADIYVNDELFDLAVAAYLRALALAPDAPAARAIRAARVLTAQGALDDTRELVTGIRELRGDVLDDEQRKQLLKLQARIAVAEGASGEEARVLKEIVDLDPLDGEALILLGQHRARAGDVEQAVFYYERAAALEAFEADAKVRHAQLLVGAGRYAEALPLLRRAQTLQPRETIQQYLEQVERVAQAR